jgi:hypothetical protein
MGLWIALGFCVVSAAAWHWLARHPDSVVAEEIRTAFWGDPMFHAVSFYFAALGIVVLLFLRHWGIDFIQVWKDLN